MSSLPERQSRIPRRARRPLKWSAGVLAALFILIGILVGLFYLAAGIVPRYHDKIQQRASAALGMPVKFGKVSLNWHGWGPEIDFREVRVLDAKTGRIVLSAQRLGFDFTLPGLVHGTHALPSGIHIDAPRLAAEVMPNGRIRIPGLSLTRPSPARNLSDMLGLQLAITHGVLRLTLAGGKPTVWVVAPVDLDVGGGRSHTVELTLGMPKALGAGTLRLDGRLDTPDTSLENWRWSGTYALNRLLLAHLDRFVPQGYPAVRGTLASSGKFSGEGLHLKNGAGQLGAIGLAAGPSRLPRFRTNFDVATANGYAVTLSDTRLVEPHATWMPGRVSAGRTASGRFHASVAHLALAALPPLTGFLPTKLAPFGTRLHKMNPSGSVEGVKFALTPGQRDLNLQARLNDVGVYAADGAPGFNHLSGSAAIHDGAGAFVLDAPGFTLRMPHIFHHPVTLDGAAGKIGVSLNAAGLKLTTEKLAINGPSGLAGTLKGEIRIPRSGPITLNLAAKAGPIAVVPARKLYLPAGLMPKALDEWLLEDFDGGTITGATLTLSGQAERFPFTTGGGRFAVDFGFSGVALKPGEHWESLEDLHGSVHFLNAGMSAEITGGRIGHGARVVKASVSLPDMFKPDLAVHAEVAGDASDFLAFLLASPIGGKLQGLDSVQASGPASAKVSLDLPVMQIENFRLDGTLKLAGVAVQYAKLPYALKDLAGTVSFDATGPTAGSLTGELLSTPISIGLTRRADGKSAQLTLAGDFPVSTLSQVANHDFSRYADGTLPLDAVVTVPLVPGGPPLTASLNSNLQGLALKLPPPVGKPAASKMQFSAHGSLADGGLDVIAHYAGVLSACANLALEAASAKLRGADVVLGPGDCHMPASGLYVRGGWPKLEVKPWLAELPQHKKTTSLRSWTPPKALDIDLHFGQIEAFGQRFDNQTIKGHLSPAQMNLDFAGDMLAGQVLIPRKPTNANPITATLTRGRFTVPGSHSVVVPPPTSAAAPLSAAVPAVAAASAKNVTHAPTRASAARGASASSAAETNASSTFSPQEIPPFTLRAAHLELGTAALDDVNIVARGVPGGISVDPIHVGGGALKLEGSLVWLRPPGGNEQVALHFVTNVQQLGKLLTGLGVGPVITGHGALSAGLAWHTLPGENNFASELLGRVSVDLRDGSISQVNPGAGRLLSLLNMANIPRYLVFNFHNLFGKGFPFSRIHGDYVIDRGIAHTKGLFIDSSVAKIKLTGSVNIAQGTMNQKAEIEPNYFGSLPIVAALVGGLGIGAAVYALTKLFGSPLAALTKMEYTIAGPISDPVVKPLGKTPAPKAGTRVAPLRAPAAATGG